MAAETFRCDKFTVRVSDAGESRPPWDRDNLHFAYRVTVRRGDQSYSTKAYGSLQEFDHGHRDRRAAGATVLQELASAAVDPEEFVSLVVGKTEGRERPVKLRSANAWINAAERLGAADAQSCRDDSGDIELHGRR